MMLMKYAVVGGDVRFAHLARMLAEGGRDAQGFLQQGTNQDVAQLADYDCVLSRWPMDRCDEVMRAIPSGATLLLCGPKFPEERRSDLRYVNLWSDQRLLEENAYLTAEAAVAFELAPLWFGECETVLLLPLLPNALAETLQLNCLSILVT